MVIRPSNSQLGESDRKAMVKGGIPAISGKFGRFRGLTPYPVATGQSRLISARRRCFPAVSRGIRIREPLSRRYRKPAGPAPVHVPPGDRPNPRSNSQNPGEQQSNRHRVPAASKPVAGQYSRDAIRRPRMDHRGTGPSRYGFRLGKKAGRIVSRGRLIVIDISDPPLSQSAPTSWFTSTPSCLWCATTVIGIDKRDCHYVIPVQAKGKNDQIGIVQPGQDIRFAEQRFPGMRCRTIAAQFLRDEVVALFELTLPADEIKVMEERHYRLVPADHLDADAIRRYRAWLVVPFRPAGRTPVGHGTSHQPGSRNEGTRTKRHPHVSRPSTA